MGKTLAEKVWDEHVVRSAPGEPDLLTVVLARGLPQFGRRHLVVRLVPFCGAGLHRRLLRVL